MNAPGRTTPVQSPGAILGREGWQPEDDWLPGRLLNEPLTLPSGRVATLTAERLRSMIDAYYAMRGLDGDGYPDPAALPGLLLG